MIIFIIESPGKLAKIQHILGKNYIVFASYGHIFDLNPKGLSIDLEHHYEPEYIIMPDRIKVYNELKKLYSKHKEIIFGTDNDVEGEAIGNNIKEQMNITSYKRVIYNEITEHAIKEALLKSRKFDEHLVNYQKARRVLDRIYGYLISPILWKNVSLKLSAGRVQSVTTKIIIEKELEIEKALKEQKSYYLIDAIFNKNTFKMYNLEKSKNNILSGDISKLSQENVIKLMKLFKKSKFNIFNVFDKISTRSPPVPFTTSSIQQECDRRFGMSTKLTMQVLQSLYEGGFITYHRTDSVLISSDMIKKIENHVNTKYGNDYLKIRQYKNKSNSQGAHECIRMTEISKFSIAVNENALKVYQLIYRRTVASQMMEAKIKTNIIQITMDNIKNYYFEGKSNSILFEGFMKVYHVEDDNEVISKFNITKDSKLKLDDIIAYEKYNNLPSRFTEGTLVKELENYGIGRPSTYASIISKIIERTYIEKKDIKGISKEITNYSLNKGIIKENIVINGETNKLIPTQLGFLVNNFLQLNFSQLLDYTFTANMEKQLDDILENKIKWYDLVDKFYKELKKQIDNIKVIEDHSLGEGYFTKISKYGPVVYKLDGKKKVYAPIKEPLTIKNITIKDAERLLEYPKLLGTYKKHKVYLQTGQYGFYLKYNKSNYKVDDNNIDIEKAKKIIDEQIETKNKSILHKVKEYEIKNGPYGLYITYMKNKKKYNIKLPERFNENNLKEINDENIQEIINEGFSKKKLMMKISKK